MNKSSNLKKIVNEKYTAVAEKGTSCCDSECGCIDDVSFIGEQYEQLEGHLPEADLQLGCGIPTEYADIKEGNVVVDLGSGAGNDCFVARSIVGPYGTVIGVDFTAAMIDKAKNNADKLRYKNVHFVLGDIENIPLGDDAADVVVSNCVLNLVPDKKQAFAETFRILRPGGHFSISDVVIKGELPETMKKSAEMYAGCVSGAVSQEDYLNLINSAGFEKVRVQKERKINIPRDILEKFISKDEIDRFNHGEIGIYSITVSGEKPSVCCETDCCQ